MTVKLDIDILQAHNVCRDGQVKFRRHFGRSKLWLTLEAFEQDLRRYLGEWDWEEAQQKFNIERNEYTALVYQLGGPEDPDDDDEDDGVEREMTYREAWCSAWARLYWAKLNPTMDTIIPTAARAYLEAVDALESTIRLKGKLTPGIRVDVELGNYHRGDSDAFCKFMAKRAQEDLKAEVDLAIRHMERVVVEKRDALAELLHPVTVTVEVPPTQFYDEIPTKVARRLSHDEETQATKRPRHPISS